MSCKKDGDYVVWVGSSEKNTTFVCERHLGDVALSALHGTKKETGPVKVAVASCDDAPCQWTSAMKP